MLTWRTIFVAVADPSSAEQPALRRAAQLAAAFDARLVLFHAAFDSALTGRPFFDSKRLATSRGSFVHGHSRALERHARPLRAQGLAVDVRVVWEEPAHEAVIRAALREKAALVVVGRHERRANRAPQFRPSDWELMRLCPRPLLVAHPKPRPASRSAVVLAALDPTHANDKSASLDVAIVSHACAIAAALRVECHAVHAVPESAYPLGKVTSKERKRTHRSRDARLQELIDKADADVAAAHVVRGNVPESLQNIAHKLPAQMLVMGIVSRRWMKRFVIGDTAEHVIRDLPCDLLLIKPQDFRLRLGRIRKESVVLPKENKR